MVVVSQIEHGCSGIIGQLRFVGGCRIEVLIEFREIRARAPFRGNLLGTAFNHAPLEHGAKDWRREDEHLGVHPHLLINIIIREFDLYICAR